MKKILFIASLAFPLLFSTNGFAEKSCKAGGSDSACVCMHNLTEKLGLTNEQQAKIKKIREHAKASRLVHKHQLHLLHDQIKALTHAEKLDEPKMNALLDQKKAIVLEMIKNRMEVRQQIEAVLTHEQKEKFHAMMLEWEKKHAEMKKERLEEMDEHETKKSS